jgi:hypothetical protein
VKEVPVQVVAASALLWTVLYFASRLLLPLSTTYYKWDRERQYKARGEYDRKCRTRTRIGMKHEAVASIRWGASSH